MIKWIKSYFHKEVELTVWFQSETIVSSDGMKTISRSKKVFRLRRVIKATPTHIIAEDLGKKQFEIKTVEPFDYFLRVVK
jgi:hypothetical protein